MNEHTEDPIPKPVLDLIAVFREKLPSVVFPDVSLEVIEGLAERVRESSANVEEAQHRLDVAKEEFAQSIEELQQKSGRALAYAKVFAEGQEELGKQLAAINLLKPARAPRRSSPERERPDAPQTRRPRASHGANAAAVEEASGTDRPSRDEAPETESTL